MSDQKQLARRLMNTAGTTYAAETGIRLNDKPMPLFQLLVLCMLGQQADRRDDRYARRAGTIR